MQPKKTDYALAVRRFERTCGCVWVGNRRVKAYRVAGTPQAGYYAMLCAYRARQHATGGAA